jgi:hypothetical protein
MTHEHSLESALALAENVDEDAHDYRTVRELKIQLRALVKDQETFGLPATVPHLIAKLRNLPPETIATIYPEPKGQAAA